MTAAEAAARCVEALDAVPLDVANRRAELQRRIDRKYIVDAERFAAFAEAARDLLLVVEVEERGVSSYRTVYFDTEERVTYRGHVQRRRRRYKVRRREYVESAASWFEVKLKDRRGETVKRRLRLDAPGAPNALDPHETAFFRTVVRDAYGHDPDERLVPALTVEYRRLTLVSREAPERVTCDFDLSVRDASGRRFALDPSLLVVESKSRFGRGAADKILRTLRVHPLRLSKYVVGTALARGGGANDFLRASRRFAALADERSVE